MPWKLFSIVTLSNVLALLVPNLLVGTVFTFWKIPIQLFALSKLILQFLMVTFFVPLVAELFKR